MQVKKNELKGDLNTGAKFFPHRLSQYKRTEKKSPLIIKLNF